LVIDFILLAYDGTQTFRRRPSILSSIAMTITAIAWVRLLGAWPPDEIDLW
jgi:hypothetical protein